MDGLQLLIDNTTLHRLAVVADAEHSPLKGAEMANVLHLIECLVLAEHLTVNSFESQASQDRSSMILDWLANTGNGDLISASPLSDRASQMEIASSVALEMYERGLIAPRKDTAGDIDEIDVKRGRPVGVVEVAGPFWGGLADDLDDLSLVQSRAWDEVEQHQTDGLFVYGVAQHEEIVSWLDRVYSKGKQPNAKRWAQMHVVFRALFNQQLAERQEAQSYAPPPVRAAALRTVYSQTIAHLQAALGSVALGLHADMDNQEFAEELLQAAANPLPLLGLAYMLQADALEGSTAPFSDRLQAARELAAPLRARLGRLDLLAKTDPARYLRNLRTEAQVLEEVSRSRLGLAEADGLGFQFDVGVTLDASSGAPSLRLGMGGGLRSVSELVRSGLARRRVSVLSDGLVQTIQHRTIGQAVRQAVR